MKDLKMQTSSPLPFDVSEEKQKTIEKRGRKTKSLTTVLSIFLAKNKKASPRNEFIRCCLLSKMLKMIRSILNDKARIFLHPSYAVFCIIVKTHSEYVLGKIDKNNFPYRENKKNLLIKTYNKNFYKAFFCDVLMRQIFEVFIEFVFGSYTLKGLQKYIGVYCCKETCEDESLCRVKYHWLKEAVLEDFLRLFLE